MPEWFDKLVGNKPKMPEVYQAPNKEDALRRVAIMNTPKEKRFEYGDIYLESAQEKAKKSQEAIKGLQEWGERMRKK